MSDVSGMKGMMEMLVYLDRCMRDLVELASFLTEDGPIKNLL